MLYLEESMDAKCIQQLKNKVAQRLAGCKARLIAGTIIRENEDMIEFNDVDGNRHFYIAASANVMEDFIANNNINFDTLGGIQLVQIIKALMEFGSSDINHSEMVIAYLMYLLGNTIETIKL